MSVKYNGVECGKPGDIEAPKLITHLTHLRFDYERGKHPLSAQRELRPPEGHTALAYGASVGTM